MTQVEAKPESKILDQVWTPDRVQDFLGELTRRRESIRDFRVDSQALRFDTDGVAPALAFQTNGDENVEQFALNPLAHAQLANRLKIPKQYYDRMLEESPELLQENVETWFNKNPQKYLLRTLDGRARAVLSSRYRILDNYDLLTNAVLPAIQDFAEGFGSPLQVLQSALTERRLYMKVVTDRIEGEVAQGDIVQAGFIVSNSEVGAGTWKIEQFIWRLACLNGMVTGLSMRKFHIGSGSDDESGSHEIYTDSTRRKMDDALIGQTRDIIGACLDRDKFEDALNNIRKQTGVPIQQDPGKVVEITGRGIDSRGFTESEQAAVVENLMKGGDLSAWGLINAVTAIAKDVNSYDRSVELERFGGKLVEYNPADWQRVMEQAKN